MSIHRENYGEDADGNRGETLVNIETYYDCPEGLSEEEIREIELIIDELENLYAQD
jgi:hypothetical protein